MRSSTKSCSHSELPAAPADSACSAPHGRGGFPHPTTAGLVHGRRFCAWGVKLAPEGCRWIRVLQRLATTSPAKWTVAWPHTGHSRSRDSNGTDLSLRLAQECFVHPARLAIHHSARRHWPVQKRACSRRPVRHKFLSIVLRLTHRSQPLELESRYLIGPQSAVLADCDNSQQERRFD